MRIFVLLVFAKTKEWLIYDCWRKRKTGCLDVLMDNSGMAYLDYSSAEHYALIECGYFGQAI